MAGNHSATAAVYTVVIPDFDMCSLVKRLVDLSDRLKSHQTMIGALSIPQQWV